MFAVKKDVLRALVLASIAITRAWFQGSIFEVAREYVQARGGILESLLLCPLCLTFYVTFALAILLLWVPIVVQVLGATALVQFYWDFIESE